MIAYLKGRVRQKSDNYVIVVVHDVGYQVYLDNRTLDSAVLNQEAELYTYQHVREDALTLYGFLSEQSKKMFLTLHSVTGIGPKSALAFLSAYSVGEIAGAIYRSDVGFLSSVSGVGKKTAEKVVIDLKDKILKLFPDSIDRSSSQAKPMAKSFDRIEESFLSEINAALRSLGYSPKEIEQSVSKNADKIAELTSVEDVIRLLLKNM